MHFNSTGTPVDWEGPDPDTLAYWDTEEGQWRSEYFCVDELELVVDDEAVDSWRRGLGLDMGESPEEYGFECFTMKGS